MPRFAPNAEHVRQFNQDGYVMARQLFDAQEMDLLLKVGRGDREKANQVHAAHDATGGASKLWLDAQLNDDIYSAIAASRRVVEPMQALVGGRVCHFHHKMMVKEPRVGGAWEWHQDYGYWYRHEGYLFPDLASCYISVDRATKINGCLQVLRGSNRCGRIEHGVTGGQTGADLARVEALMKHLELVHCEMEPGDALFFHGNTLHRSDKNTSEFPRWSLICCYALQGNPAFLNADHLKFDPVQPLEDARILEVGLRQLAAIDRALQPF